ncbi:hypothetical protein HPB52_022302 [Rhipicephalus sanguineus]|uniref:Uncharacterized protein n=1 Tax=Rhipicephalus sanguineus TaxID=34632 RepID=A0A9D4Q342_RHISA|nr:hypothetical protein HPB52_022302 [Rhipicephalus sanguineus]
MANLMMEHVETRALEVLPFQLKLYRRIPPILQRCRNIMKSMPVPPEVNAQWTLVGIFEGRELRSVREDDVTPVYNAGSS